MVTLLLPLSLWLAGDRVPALAGAEPSEFVGNWARQTSGGPAAGKFLVADRKLGDPNFARTVVLILGHGTRGSTGLDTLAPSGSSPKQISARLHHYDKEILVL